MFLLPRKVLKSTSLIQLFPLAVESYFQPFQFEVEEVNVMRTTGIVIDDDNEPAPENIPKMKKSEGATYEP